MAEWNPKKAHRDVINCALTYAIIPTFSIENISKA
jgi:hypothetical protein